MSRNDRLLAYAFSATVIIVLLAFGYLQCDDYARIEDFALYRNAFNLANGDGLVFNPDEKAWPTISPLPDIILGGFARAFTEITALRFSYMYLMATALWSISYGLASGLLFVQLRHLDLKRAEAALIVIGWLIAWPVWAGFRSPAPLTMLFILLALAQQKHGRRAGLFAGLAAITQPEGILGALAVGILVTNTRRFWQVVWVPTALWAIVAAFYYEDAYLEGLTIGQLATEGTTLQNLLWIGLLATSALVLSTANIKNWLWVMVLWAALEISARLLVYGELTQIQSAPLALSIVAALVLGSRHILPKPQLVIGGGLVALTLLTVIWSPQTEDDLAFDIQLGASLLLPADSDLITDRSDGILAKMDDFNGNLYRLDGERSLWVEDFVERRDYQSLVIAAAPRYLYFNTTTSPLAEIDLKALNYRKELDFVLDPGQRESDELWIQRSTAPPFRATQAIDNSFGPDVQLIGYATDRYRLKPGDRVRIRLDWRLDRVPTDEITVQISLLDFYRTPIISIFPIFPASTWEPLKLSTYHMLTVPDEVENPGVVDIQVALDYKAAILGRHTIGPVVVNLPQPETLPSQNMGRVGEIILYEANVEAEKRQLQIDLMWGLEKSLERDYQVLVHLRSDDESVAFGDGPPVDGRYPTSFWQPGEVIPDSHEMSLADVSPGEYQLVVGFYILETFEPLGDTLTIEQIIIDNDGTITVGERRRGIW